MNGLNRALDRYLSRPRVEPYVYLISLALFGLPMRLAFLAGRYRRNRRKSA